MLPAPNRMRHGTEFTSAVRRGRRAGRSAVVLHLGASDSPSAPRVGFVVPKSVGSAVVRNRVKRRLRHVLRERVDRLPSGALLVVRAQPRSAVTEDLAKDVDSALASVLRERA